MTYIIYIYIIYSNNIHLHSKSHNSTLHKRRMPILLLLYTLMSHAPPRVATHFSHTRTPPRSPAHLAIPWGGTPSPPTPAPSPPPAVTTVVPPLLIPAWPRSGSCTLHTHAQHSITSMQTHNSQLSPSLHPRHRRHLLRHLLRTTTDLSQRQHTPFHNLTE